jgi:hypothetical protein
MSNKFANALKKDKPAQEAATESKAPSIHERPARKGAKHVGGYFPPEVSKQLRQIALDEDTSVQGLLAEALDMVFHSRKMPTIAQPKIAE